LCYGGGHLCLSPATNDNHAATNAQESKKPRLVAEAKCLTILVGRQRFELWTYGLEVPAGIVAQIMGHKPSATAEKHYRVRPLDLLRMWHTKIEGWILEQAGIEQPSEEEKPGLRVINA